MTIPTVLRTLDSEEANRYFVRLYGAGEEAAAEQKSRYAALVEQFRRRFGSAGGEDGVRMFSSPGRSEIGGNHTDHNHGKTLAASIQLDALGVVATCEENRISICDSTYHEDYAVDITEHPELADKNGSPALVRGIIAGFKNAGFAIGGFKGCFESRVPPGSGMSSSAAFEMLICGILNALYNDGAIPIEKLAAIGQYAENVFWGKASGLMDQMACAAGGVIALDFERPATPALERIPFDFETLDYRLVIVNTGGSHANLSAEYSAIPAEMKRVASFFGKDVLRGLTAEELTERLPALRQSCGDRAVLRALHFIEENNRVDEEIKALKENNFAAFLRLAQESGDSSCRWLQNAVTPGAIQEQNIPICLAMTELFFHLHGLSGAAHGAAPLAACRLHGGGFAGVIQVFLPGTYVEAYRAWMHTVLGFALAGDAGRHIAERHPDPVFAMSIRPCGVRELRGNDASARQ
ncbi:MAG: galactokinase [Treponema sp.]|jgi:galactokinase|nr:galactokinase [Treponema sp.]